MLQRLYLFLAMICISGMAFCQNVMSPSDGDYIYDSLAPAGSLTNPIPVEGVIQKWVHDTTQRNLIKWSQEEFKSYRMGNLSFRLRFPNNYDPTKKYPLILYMHGGGEAAFLIFNHNTATVNRENESQLYAGAKYFRDSVNAGSLNAFMLYPQLLALPNYAGAQWDQNTIPPLNNILDTLEKYNGLDPDRVIVMGISNGGLGCIKYASLYPKRIASVISSSPAMISDVLGSINGFFHIPIYVTVGGLDINPLPIDVIRIRDSFAVRGGDMYLGYYPTNGHDTWNTQWQQKNIYNRLLITAYWNNASKAQPLLYFQNDKFCQGQPIHATMGITAGFFAYEWQRDGGSGFTTIAGATDNTFTATQTGQYRVRYKRTSAYNWSVWTPNPIVISTKACVPGDTAFAEHFETTPVSNYVTFTGGAGGGNSAYFKNNTGCQNGLFVNGTLVFTQDASGRQGGKFMLNNTTSSGCNYNSGDQVWRTYFPANVQPNTNYTFSFYMANEGRFQTLAPTDTVASLVPVINHMPLSPVGLEVVSVGQLGWKKYSFNWYSGNNTQAELAITNNTATGNGNDFVIDEISLVKAKPVPMPGGALKNVQLWAKGNSITGFDGGPVGVWPNNDINGTALTQPLNTSQPVFETVGTDNINYNPVTTYVPATNKFMFTPGGFAGTTAHNAVYAYLVTKATTNTQNAVLLREGPDTNLVMAQTTGSVMKWAGGENFSIQTASGAIDTKPTIWSFSKSTASTPSGNKQDIRKNGVVVASGNKSSVFTSAAGQGFFINAFKINPTTFLGSYGGTTAEVIYIIDSGMTASKQRNIESYLALKYGMTLGSTITPVNYTASDSTVYWTGSATYQNDVFGIGTDSATALVQTISNSVNTANGDGTGQSGKGNLVLWVNVPLPDKRFLVIGNDGASLAQSVIPAGGAASIAVGSTRVNRAWKVSDKGSTGLVNLAFDTTGLGNQQGGTIVSNYALMIDNDGDGDFNTGVLSFFNAGSAAGKRINFNGVVLHHGVVFTILTLRLTTALPAVWLGFTAEAVNGNALLKWKTSDEMNVDHYVVEHSYDGVSFSVIGSKAANNSTGENNYTFSDNGLSSGSHYYRIRRADKDGKTGLSNIQSIKIAVGGANLQVRPNPVTGSTLVLEANSRQTAKTLIQVMAVDGKVLLQQKADLVSGHNLVNLDVSHMPSGVYLVQVQLNNELITKKFIRQQ